MKMTHELKILPEFFDPVADHIKNFELRKNDRGFEVGDKLVLKEWDGQKYTGREYRTSIIYILRIGTVFPDVINDYVILGLEIPKGDAE